MAQFDFFSNLDPPTPGGPSTGSSPSPEAVSRTGRGPERPGDTVTLAEVLEALASAPELTPTRRRDLASAVRRMPELLGGSSSTLFADPAALRAGLNAVVLADHGITQKTCQKLVSNLAAAIEASGLVRILRTGDIEPDPAWRALLTPEVPVGISYALSRFARFCTREGISPTEVTVGTFDRFAVVIERETFTRDPRQVIADTRRSWLKLAALCPDRGLVTFPAAEKVSREKALIPLGTYPGSFTADLDAYIAWLTCADPFALDARARAVAPGTANLQRRYVIAAASALVQSGTPADQITSLADLVTPAAFRAVLTVRLAQVDGKPNAHNFGIAAALVQVAKDWVKVPTEQLNELKRLRSKLPATKPGLTPKNLEVLRRFEDPRLLGAFLSMPERLFAESQAIKKADQRLAHIQAALALAILLDLPMRIKNLVQLRFGHEVFMPPGPHGVAEVQILYEDVKNAQGITASLSLATTRMLHLYRDKFAPEVLDERPVYIFAANRGGAKCKKTISDLFTRTVKRQLGFHMTPHQIRHLSAKLILDADHGAFERVRQLLCHKSTKVTIAFYAGLDTRRAARAHQDLLAKLREDMALPRGRSRKPRGGR